MVYFCNETDVENQYVANAVFPRPHWCRDWRCGVVAICRLESSIRWFCKVNENRRFVLCEGGRIILSFGFSVDWVADSSALF